MLRRFCVLIGTALLAVVGRAVEYVAQNTGIASQVASLTGADCGTFDFTFTDALNALTADGEAVSAEAVPESLQLTQLSILKRTGYTGSSLYWDWQSSVGQVFANVYELTNGETGAFLAQSAIVSATNGGQLDKFDATLTLSDGSTVDGKWQNFTFARSLPLAKGKTYRVILTCARQTCVAQIAADTTQRVLFNSTMTKSPVLKLVATECAAPVTRTATVSGNADWSAIAWDNGTPAAADPVELTFTAGAKLTFNSVAPCSSLTVVSDPNVELSDLGRLGASRLVKRGRGELKLTGEVYGLTVDMQEGRLLLNNAYLNTTVLHFAKDTECWAWGWPKLRYTTIVETEADADVTVRTTSGWGCAFELADKSIAATVIKRGAGRFATVMNQAADSRPTFVPEAGTLALYGVNMSMASGTWAPSANNAFNEVTLAQELSGAGVFEVAGGTIVSTSRQWGLTGKVVVAEGATLRVDYNDKAFIDQLPVEVAGRLVLTGGFGFYQVSGTGETTIDGNYDFGLSVIKSSLESRSVVVPEGKQLAVRTFSNTPKMTLKNLTVDGTFTRSTLGNAAAVAVRIDTGCFLGGTGVVKGRDTKRLLLTLANGAGIDATGAQPLAVEGEGALSVEGALTVRLATRPTALTRVLTTTARPTLLATGTLTVDVNGESYAGFRLKAADDGLYIAPPGLTISLQ